MHFCIRATGRLPPSLPVTLEQGLRQFSLIMACMWSVEEMI